MIRTPVALRKEQGRVKRLQLPKSASPKFMRRRKRLSVKPSLRRSCVNNGLRLRESSMRVTRISTMTPTWNEMKTIQKRRIRRWQSKVAANLNLANQMP